MKTYKFITCEFGYTNEIVKEFNNLNDAILFADNLLYNCFACEAFVKIYAGNFGRCIKKIRKY